MSLGNSLYQARKKSGLSQEIVAEKLGVSRQTISKWETDDTVPDIYQAKKLSKIYNLSLDELIEFDTDLKQIEETIKLVSKIIKFGFIPIGQKKIPKVDCKEGNLVTIIYNEDNPEKGHIEGNDGIINC